MYTFENIFKSLKNKKLTIATAESCTGGLLAKYITDIPGSSEVFMGSIISYSNSAKEEILKVNKETLTKFGAVSEECAREMALGAQKIFKTDIGISTTGIAGPDGDTPEKPVGLVHTAIIYKTELYHTKLRLTGNRSDIRDKTCENIFAKLNDILS